MNSHKNQEKGHILGPIYWVVASILESRYLHLDVFMFIRFKVHVSLKAKSFSA